MKHSKLLFLILSFFIFSSVNVFAQDSLANACVKEATQDHREAIKDAEFEFKSKKNTCRFGAEIGACMTDCLPALKTCLEPINASLKDCRKECLDTLLEARSYAKEVLGCGTTCNTNADFQKAIVKANLAYRTCRVDCLSSVDTIDARVSCRTAHNTCINACKE